MPEARPDLTAARVADGDYFGPVFVQQNNRVRTNGHPPIFGHDQAQGIGKTLDVFRFPAVEKRFRQGIAAEFNYYPVGGSNQSVEFVNSWLPFRCNLLGLRGRINRRLLLSSERNYTG
ncbi:MAG: hypothetical protein QUS14_02425 [Pyrinomonadaceae bacterium]|nr:hypothetical protein [Pyrinomonadaceae bacterium]